MSKALPKILIFAGTTEGRILSETLADAGICHTVCVATAYGEDVLKENPFAEVHQGRMNQEQIENFLCSEGFSVVVDATHPFACDITRNIQAAVQSAAQSGISVNYLRLKRDGFTAREEGIAYFETNEECARALENTEGNILLTIGSKELSKYCVCETLKNRLYVRILPTVESLSLCIAQGISGRQIIAMQGPFTAEMNAAVINQYKISCIVTKESGAAGGYQEKLAAAKRTGAQIYVIGCPKDDEGYSFSEVCERLEEICGKNFWKKDRTSGQAEQTEPVKPIEQMEIILAGIGMGHPDILTKEVERAISAADILLGAERMLENVNAEAEKHPVYQAEQIIPYLCGLQRSHDTRTGSGSGKKKKIVVLFSGDSGFYSGCQSLYAALKQEIAGGHLNASVHILPGISSVAYLASCIGESYQDAAIYSMHGKTVCNLARRIKNSPRTFLLTSGVRDINRLGELLTDAGLTECEVITGYQLSYKEQRIDKHTPSECRELKEEGLYTCFVRNPYSTRKRLTHGIADAQFIREQVPMTKEEVREVSICKLYLHEGATVCDIGSGTGSIAVEIASISDDIQVYAIEHKKEAAALIEKNKKKFGLQNITVIEASAPEGLRGLSMITHAFIGGSGGKLKEILTALRTINPRMRVVVNAISMETICEIKEILSAKDGIEDDEVIQMQVNRVKKAGNHHLVQSENPVWICAFTFCG